MTSANVKLKDSKLFLSKIATETLIAERDYYKNKFKGGRNKEKYHDWVYMADDQINKVLKTLIISVYGYGAYIFIVEMWSKYI